MATFTNQTTNLSNLSATLGLLCRALEGPLPPDNSKDEASKREEAEEFLDRVVERVDLVDEALMKSTEHLLPTLTSGRGDEPSRMTATELSQLLSLLHGANAEKIQHLNKALAGESPRNSAASSNKEEDQENNDLNTPPYHWSLGMPLDKVVETDNETDRYSYSSASVMKSPSVFNSTPSRRQPATPCSPCTPSIAELKLSANTASILTKEIVEYDSPSPSEQRALSLSTTRDAEISFQDGNYWNRYMGDADLSVDYCRDERIMIKQPTNNEYPEKDDEDDEQEEEDESHADESTLCSTVVAEDRKARPHYYPSTIPEDRADDGTLGESTIASAQVENRYNEEEDDEEGDDGDDVTTLCPTVIANQPIPEDAAVLEDYRARNEAHHDISQVEVENDTSYSRTFLTMDGTMMNLNDLEVMSQQSSRYVNDAASLGEETPVLDRYRIDLDDNSIGFKVVPNERGSSRRKAKQNTLFKENDFTMDSPFTIPKAVQFPDRISMDAEPRHVYRKTPHPKESRLAADNAEREFTTEAISSDTLSLHFDPKIRFDVTTPTGHRKKTVFRKTPMPSKNTNVDDDQDGGGLIQRQTKVHFEPSKAYDQVTTPAKEHATKSFRKTPFPMAGKRAEVSNGVRFYASGDVSENSTPGKAKTVYRKTPCGKANISDDASSRSSSVKFSSELRFKTETPVRKPGQSYRQTPYLSARSKENEDSSFRGGDDRVRFDILDKSVSSVTLRSSKKQYRKTPHNKKIEAGLSEENENVEENYSSAEYDLYNRLKTQHSDSNTMRSPLADLSPPRATSSTPQHIRIMNREMVTTPMSMSSTLTGITGLTYTENNRELFPNTDSNAKKEKGAATGSRTSDASNPATTRAPAFATPRKSASGLIPRVTESELAQASPVVKMQASLDELNKAIYALNGAAFLKQSAANAQDQIIFSDTEAYKVLRNCGFKRRRCKGMLMSLCHFRRLRMRENDPDIYDHGGHFFEVVAPGQ